MRDRGFTLIELLVVIAIIGILSAIVLAALNSARSAARDAALRGLLANAQTDAFLYFNEHNAYVNLQSIPAETVCYDLVLHGFESNFIQNAQSGIGDCAQDHDTFALEVLLSDGVTWWCVDSTGYRGESNPGSSPNFDEPIPPYPARSGPYECNPI